MDEPCDHLWAHLRDDKWLGVRQELFFCQRDPRHRMGVPSDEDVLAQREAASQRMLEVTESQAMLMGER